MACSGWAPRCPVKSPPLATMPLSSMAFPAKKMVPSQEQTLKHGLPFFFGGVVGETPCTFKKTTTQLGNTLKYYYNHGGASPAPCVSSKGERIPTAMGWNQFQVMNPSLYIYIEREREKRSEKPKRIWCHLSIHESTISMDDWITPPGGFLFVVAEASRWPCSFGQLLGFDPLVEFFWVPGSQPNMKFSQGPSVQLLSCFGRCLYTDVHYLITSYFQGSVILIYIYIHMYNHLYILYIYIDAKKQHILIDGWCHYISNYVVINKCIEHPKRQMFFSLCVLRSVLGFHTQFHICSWGWLKMTCSQNKMQYINNFLAFIRSPDPKTNWLGGPSPFTQHKLAWLDCQAR